MIDQHWFWWSLTMACVVWYSTIVIYVAIHGVMDIKEMLTRLSKDTAEPPDVGAQAGRGDASTP